LQSALQTTSAQPPTPLLHPLFLSFSRACFPASLWSSVLHFGSWKPRFCFQPRVRWCDCQRRIVLVLWGLDCLCLKFFFSLKKRKL
jgi:hypothetical protein